MTTVTRLFTCTRGTAVAEFAMTVPVLLLLMLGIIEFGRALWIKQTLQFAVETASRTALADSTLGGTGITAIVAANLPGLGSIAPKVTVTTTSTRINVSADYTFDFLVPDLLPFGPVVISAQSNTPR